jgi:hypothetical protein
MWRGTIPPSQVIWGSPEMGELLIDASGALRRRTADERVALGLGRPGVW